MMSSRGNSYSSHHNSHSSNVMVFDDDDAIYGSGGSFRIPDKDVYRRMITTFGSVQNYFQNRVFYRCGKDRRFLQPHYTSWRNSLAPFANTAVPADGICAHFLRRGLIKPNKTQMTAAVWSADARWLVLSTIAGELALWEDASLKIYKPIPLVAHKIVSGGELVDSVPITALALNNHGNLLITGDRDGLIHYCDETLRFVAKVPEAHNGPIRGLSCSPMDSKLVSGSDDGLLHIWTVGGSTAETTLSGHQSDVKCLEWHPYRSLIASGSRDSSVKLWDPKSGEAVCNLLGHKKQVNCCRWNQNGNWLASGSKDGLIKLYDIRVMREIEVYRGHNSDVCSMSWHPQHETLLLSGGYNGSLIYWLANHNQAPHTIIADAHRQSIDVLAWHPAGHIVASASHDGILKFWSREPPGSKCETETKEFQDNPIVCHGPLAIGQPNAIPLVAAPLPGAMGPGAASGGGTVGSTSTALGGGGGPNTANSLFAGARAGPGRGGDRFPRGEFGGGRGRGNFGGVSRPAASNQSSSFYQEQPSQSATLGAASSSIDQSPGLNVDGQRKRTRFENA